MYALAGMLQSLYGTPKEMLNVGAFGNLALGRVTDATCFLLHAICTGRMPVASAGTHQDPAGLPRPDNQEQAKHLELDDACSEGSPSEDSSRAQGGRHMSSASGSVSGSGLPQGRKCCSWFTKRSSTRQLSGGALLCRQASIVHPCQQWRVYRVAGYLLQGLRALI